MSVCLSVSVFVRPSVQERQRMTDKLEDTSLRLKDEMDLYKKMMDKLKQNRHEYQKEKDAMQEVACKARRPYWIVNINLISYHPSSVIGYHHVNTCEVNTVSLRHT